MTWQPWHILLSHGLSIRKSGLAYPSAMLHQLIAPQSLRLWNLREKGYAGSNFSWTSFFSSFLNVSGFRYLNDIVYVDVVCLSKPKESLNFSANLLVLFGFTKYTLKLYFHTIKYTIFQQLLLWKPCYLPIPISTTVHHPLTHPHHTYISSP